jgi:hypothetical protein
MVLPGIPAAGFRGKRLRTTDPVEPLPSTDRRYG